MFAKTGDMVSFVVPCRLLLFINQLNFTIMTGSDYSSKIYEMADKVWNDKKSAVIIEKDSYGYVTAYVLQRMEHCVKIKISGDSSRPLELYSRNEIVVHYLGSDIPWSRIAKLTVGIVIV
jgi:hypothetical protein